jgi:GNAT superfamily N-acetyltransferase
MAPFSMKFSVRKAVIADAVQILDCLRESFAPFRDAYTKEAFLDTVLTPATLEHRFNIMTLFVALDQAGNVVGTVGCELTASREGHLRGMAVRSVWQGAGVAAELLHQAEAELVRRGCARITLDTTEPLRRAMSFYEKHGYRPSGGTRDFFGMPLFEYAKELEPATTATPRSALS